MIASHIFLALAALGIVLVVLVQDLLRPALAHESISSGLTGPMDGLLLGTFGLLAAAMVVAFIHQPLLQAVLACAAAVGLVVTGLTGWLTAQLPDGEKDHVIATAVTFSLAIALQLVTDGHSALLWAITGGAAIAAASTHFLVPNASVTEKVGVLGLCSWLVAWSFT